MKNKAFAKIARQSGARGYFAGAYAGLLLLFTARAQPAERQALHGDVPETKVRLLPVGSFPGLLSLVFFGWFVAVSPLFAQTWTQTGAPTNFHLASIASSSDGTRLVAVYGRLSKTGYGNGPIFTSTNSGLTWTSNNIAQAPWTTVASSADGMKLVAASFYQDVYTSTNAGESWSPSAQSPDIFTSLASSADGTKLAAVGFLSNDKSAYYSTNSGASWTALTNGPGGQFTSIACTADGNKLCAVEEGDAGPIFSSTNSGLSWTTTEVNHPQGTVAVSADGSKWMVPGDFTLYMSTNNGGTWMSNPNSFAGLSVAVSADGNRILGAGKGVYNGVVYNVVYTSTDGANWTSNSVPNTNWWSVAMSADGSKLFAESGDGIYTLQVTPMPQLRITPSSSNVALSWIIPSTNFVLQQSYDLASWVDLTNVPTLNFSNLQYQVCLSPTNSSGFYRLATP